MFDNKHVRHCKIVATIGPASSNEKILSGLIDAGMNIARLNFSHGQHETHVKNIEMIRRLAREKNRQVAILQDLQGPKIRCGQMLNGVLAIEKDKTYRLSFGVDQTTSDVIPIDYRELIQDAKVGQRVMMDDGLLSFVIKNIQEDYVEVLALTGGHLKSRKGVNFPGTKLSIPALTEKDRKDLLFGIANRVDFVALSFVQSPEDIRQLRRIIAALGADTPIVAKIEMLAAVEQIDEIAEVTDGLMVARGDLGVEASVENVPSFQRRIIDAATRKGKPVIIATQMLESMVDNPRPTFAEVADVANGVLDGADCVMLSAESASGKYPIECVKKMSEIISEIEQWTFRRPVRYIGDESKTQWQDHEAIARAACEAADALSARAIICLTLTGSIAKIISAWRPNTPIIAISPRQDIIQRLMMVWGVYGIPNPIFYDTDTLLQDLPLKLKEIGLVKKDEVIVITAGIPINQMKATNMIKINRVP